MKRCATCGELKDESEFNWRWKSFGILHPTCRVCHKTYRKNWYENNKETHLANVYERKQRVIQDARAYVWNYLSTHPCVSCGERDPVVLEFDHLYEKDKDISAMAGQGYSIEAIRNEISKCQVLCANCHRRKTSKERKWYSG
jgi:5-methylcytosine-specific restriction endonuclease McrA